MPRPDPNASDWSDLDLLTVTEATERLTDELAEVRARIAGLTGEPGAGDELAAYRRREDLLERAMDRALRPRGAIPGLPPSRRTEK
ncbi:hypothetical protein GCM10023321_23630 [Pseudonocardia eucalypti]|uniref:Uncharacterized protein n=1 Tax=Pseudonocardia eucalypti TaxID=648755 RepID=A0ABP9Q1S0_9PSEU|nr:hypothetical protein [Pseudonocardia eucalypti]